MGLFKKKVKRYNIPKHEATPTSFQNEVGNVLEFCYDTAVDQNPDRGFRGELYITLGSGRQYPEDKGTAIEHFEKSINNYKEEKVKNYQLYVYLNEFYNKPISKEAFNQLKEYFEMMEKLGLRILLRFAYEYTRSVRKGPKTEQIKNHCKQIKQWISDNEKLFNQTVYAMQVGMIGLWGEGHSSVHRHNFSDVMSAVFDTAPESMTIMARTPAFLDQTPEKYRDRISIHDDFLIGKEHPWGMLPFSHPDNQALYTMAQHRLTDGEMPWGKDKTVAVIDPILFIKQCSNYGLRTLSIEHNYKENGNVHHLQAWKNVFVTKSQLEENNLPYFPALLEENQISVFDYLKCHLGYLLAITNLQKENNIIKFDMFNFGMGVPIDFQLKIIADGKRIEIAFDPQTLCQFSSQNFEIPCEKELKIKLVHIRDNSLSIKLANKLDYVDGYNIIQLK